MILSKARDDYQLVFSPVHIKEVDAIPEMLSRIGTTGFIEKIRKALESSRYEKNTGKGLKAL